MIEVNEIKEIVQDHLGEYQVKKTEDIKNDYQTKLFEDGTAGLSADDNLVVDIGASFNDIFWVEYYSKKSMKTEARGRRHIVYVERNFDNLYDYKKLLCFPFADEEESQKIISAADNSELLSEQRKERISKKITEFTWDKIKIQSRVLFHLVCFIHKKIFGKYTNFLYIEVPDEVLDYQKYCLSIMKTIIDATPVGWRKKIRFATNANEEKDQNFGILFRKSSLLDGENRKKSIFINDKMTEENLPAFIKDYKFSEEICKLIELCAQHPQSEDENSEVYRCYMMEQKVGLNELKDNDYVNYVAIAKLSEKPLDYDLLKVYNERLEKTELDFQLEALQQQIRSRITKSEILDKLLSENDENNSDMESWFTRLNSCKELLVFLKNKGITVSEQYMSDQLNKKRCVIFYNMQDDVEEEVSLLRDKLGKCDEWKKQLDKYGSKFEELAVIESWDKIRESNQKEIDKLKSEIKGKRTNEWKNILRSNCTTVQIQNIKSEIKSEYPNEYLQIVQSCADILKEKTDQIQSKNMVLCVDAFCEEGLSLKFEQCVKEKYEEGLVNNVLEELRSNSKQSGAYSSISKMIRNGIAKVKTVFAGDSGYSLEKAIRNKMDPNRYSDLLKKMPIEELKELSEVFEEKESNWKKSIDKIINDNIKNTYNDAMGAFVRGDSAKLDKALSECSSYLQNSRYEDAKNYISNQAHTRMQEWQKENGANEQSKIENLYKLLSDNELTTKPIKKLYDEWKDKKETDDKKERIKKEIKSFLQYFHAGRAYQFSDVEKKEALIQIAKNPKYYTLKEFITAIEYSEGKSLDDKIKKDSAFLQREKDSFKSNPLGFRVKKGDSLPELYWQLKRFSELSVGDKVKCQNLEKNPAVKNGVISVQACMDAIELLIFLANFQVLEDQQVSEVLKKPSDPQIEFMVAIHDKGILQAGATIRALEEICSGTDKRAEMQWNKFIEELETKNEGLKKKQKLTKLKNILLCVAILSLCFFAGGASFALISHFMDNKVEDDPKPGPTIESMLDTSDIETESEKIPVETESESIEEGSEELQSTDEQKETFTVSESLSSLDAGASQNEESSVHVSEVKQVKGRIEAQEGSSVNIRREPRLGGEVCFVVNSGILIDVMMDQDRIEADGRSWVKIHFLDSHKDNENRTVEKGMEAYVSIDYIETIDENN